MNKFYFQESEVATTTANIPVADGKFGGCSYFNCPNETFNKGIKGRNKRQHWKTFLNGDSELASRIRAFKSENPKEKLILRNRRTGEMVFAQSF